MPIYGYRCTSCGHEKDVLQKLSDPMLVVCPACSAEAFARQVSAPSFQLKGSGWYVTDFRDGGKGKKGGDSKGESGGLDKAQGADKSAASSTEASNKSGEGKASDAKASDGKAANPAPAPAPSPAAAPAASGKTTD